MIGKYKYFLIVCSLVLVSFMFIYETNSSMPVFSTQQIEYDTAVKEFIKELDRVQDKYPVDVNTLGSEGEMYVYNALTERANVLNIYKYTETMVPTEYIDVHHRLVHFITMYREGILIAKEGIMLMNVDEIQQGILKIKSANDLLDKIEKDFILNQTTLNN